MFPVYLRHVDRMGMFPASSGSQPSKRTVRLTRVTLLKDHAQSFYSTSQFPELGFRMAAGGRYCEFGAWHGIFFLIRN